MTLRLSRKRPIWQAAVAVIPLALGLGFLLISEAVEEASQAARGPLRGPFEEAPAEGIVVSSMALPRPLPPALAVVQLERQADGMSVDDLTALVASTERASSERYSALRRLEGTAPNVAIREAEKMVMAGQQGSDTFLAVNALGALARLPEGRASLVRCAAMAPSKDLRDAAARLVMR